MEIDLNQAALDTRPLCCKTTFAPLATPRKKTGDRQGKIRDTRRSGHHTNYLERLKKYLLPAFANFCLKIKGFWRRLLTGYFNFVLFLRDDSTIFQTRVKLETILSPVFFRGVARGAKVVLQHSGRVSKAA